MTRRLLVLLLALVAATFGARSAYACSCSGDATLPDAIGYADVVFVGEVLRAKGDSEWEVRVDGMLKGDPLPRTARLWTDESSSCSSNAEPGPILFTGERDLELVGCTYVVQGESVAAELAHYGLVPIPVPDPPAGSGELPGWALPTLLAAAVAGIAAATRVRFRRAAT